MASGIGSELGVLAAQKAGFGAGGTLAASILGSMTGGKVMSGGAPAVAASAENAAKSAALAEAKAAQTAEKLAANEAKAARAAEGAALKSGGISFKNELEHSTWLSN